MSIERGQFYPLEILILACVKIGLTASYDLLNELSIGVSASSQAFERLVTQGMLTATTGARNRVQYKLTPEGDEHLKAGLAGGPSIYWNPPSRRNTFSSLRRAILLAWLNQRPDQALQCINLARRRLEEYAAASSYEAEELPKKLFKRIKEGGKEGMMIAFDDGMVVALKEVVGIVNGWIQAEMDAIEFTAQLNSLNELENLVKKLPPALSLACHSPARTE